MSRRYKIHNETRYRTRDLRRFCIRAAKEVFADDEKSNLHFRFGETSQRWVGGRAWLNGRSCRIFLPTKGEVDGVQLAHVLVHELGHCAGYDHKKMRGSAKYTWVHGWQTFAAWGDELPLELKPSPNGRPRLTGAPLAEKKLAHAIDKRDDWRRKAKRAVKLGNKWARKADYHRKRIERLSQGAP